MRRCSECDAPAGSGPALWRLRPGSPRARDSGPPLPRPFGRGPCEKVEDSHRKQRPSLTHVLRVCLICILPALHLMCHFTNFRPALAPPRGSQGLLGGSDSGGGVPGAAAEASGLSRHVSENSSQHGLQATFHRDTRVPGSLSPCAVLSVGRVAWETSGHCIPAVSGAVGTSAQAWGRRVLRPGGDMHGWAGSESSHKNWSFFSSRVFPH